MRSARLWLGLLSALLPAACDGGGPAAPLPPPALAITSMSPAPDAENVEVGATVAVVFNQAIDAATLTAASFHGNDKDVPLAGLVTYDPGTRTARTTAPFLPGRLYGAEVTTGVRTAADSGLMTPRTWTFTTRAWQPVAVDDAFAYTSLAVDAGGRRHVSYYDLSTSALKYATCAAGCDEAAAWQAVTVDSAGSVGHYTSLAVAANGRVHISYYDFGNADLKYATCASGCTATAGWQAVTVDATGAAGQYNSLAVDATGRVHISYYRATLDLRYATCAAGCEAAPAWDTVTVAMDGFEYSSLAVDAGGRVHVSYLDGNSERLRYATCAAGCDAAAGWRTFLVDGNGVVGRFSSLAVDAGGRLHVSYYDLGNADLRYATCASGCEAGAVPWDWVTVHSVGSVGEYTSLAVDAGGRLHVSYYDNGNDDLMYATCAAGCNAAANWHVITADATDNVGLYNSLAVDKSGRVHISYMDVTHGDLKYIN